MILELSRLQRFCAFHFGGLRKSIAQRLVTPQTEGCRYDGITYPFSTDHMDGKRLVAIACGAIEKDEVYLAQKYVGLHDIIVEFGCGLGIAAARVHSACSPQAHYCFEANPGVIDYANTLFESNNLNIKLENVGLGDGGDAVFYALDDYILSSFTKPENRHDYKCMTIPTRAVSDIIAQAGPTAIFCDIEGAEAQFLKPEELLGVNKVIIELHPEVYGAEKEQELISCFKQAGFRVAELSGQTYCFIRNS